MSPSLNRVEISGDRPVSRSLYHQQITLSEAKIFSMSSAQSTSPSYTGTVSTVGFGFVYVQYLHLTQDLS
jgi:hypothetical protein